MLPTPSTHTLTLTQVDPSPFFLLSPYIVSIHLIVTINTHTLTHTHTLTEVDRVSTQSTLVLEQSRSDREQAQVFP